MKMPLLAATSLAALLGVCAVAQAQETVRHFINANGQRVTVRSGQPAADHYGPKPSFAQLDRNHDGAISREEAEAFPPLANDFDYAARNKSRLTPRDYAQWDYR
jgi:hypothetical protein